VQGASNSDPSGVTSVNVPGPPLAPSLGSPSISEMAPLIPVPPTSQLAFVRAPHLTAVVR
jgi:hypothetical protein